MADVATPALLITREVAERLRVHPRTVARLVKDGELPAVVVGNGLRFDPADVEAYLRRDKLDAYVDRLVAQAPALTEAQRSRLATLLQQPAAAR